MTKEEFNKLISSCEPYEQYDLFTSYIKILENENARLREALERVRNLAAANCHSATVEIMMRTNSEIGDAAWEALEGR